MRIRILLLGLGLAFVGAACTYANTEPTEFACAYGGGWFEAKAQKGDDPIPPSSGRDFIGMSDEVIKMNADVRNYIIDKDEGTGDVPTVDFIKSPTKDGVELEYELNTRFRINYDLGCNFWEEHGKRFGIDGAEGWQEFLAQNLRPVLENRLKEQSQRYDWEAIWRNLPQEDGSSTWTLIQDDLGQALVDEVNRSLGDNYLCGVTWSPGSDNCPPFEVLIKSAVPEKDQLTNRYSEIQVEDAETERQRIVKARELEGVKLDADRDLAEANAQLEVSAVNAEKAEIDAQAAAAECRELASIGVDCTLLEAARNGSIDFWVVDGEGLTPVPTFEAGG